MSLPSQDDELNSSNFVGIPLLGSLFGSIVALFYDRRTELVALNWIPLASGRLENFYSQFNKSPWLRSFDDFRT